jgi:hypothetical protein
MAQHTSIRMSSTSFSITTLAREGMARCTLWKSGGGLPLHRLDRVQLAFLTNDEPGIALSRISEMGATAPALMTLSLT